MSSQVIVRCIAKVADAYKRDRKVPRTFQPLGAMAYDSRILSYKGNTVFIWSVGGRLHMPFACHNPSFLSAIKGEADLLYRKGKFYLLQTVEVPEEDVNEVEEFIGVDFGLVSIATLSTGKEFSSNQLIAYREKRQTVRSSVQRKGTRSSRKLLKRLTGRERTTASIINHTIAKQIVSLAREEGKGIALEELRGIRFASLKKGRKFKSRVGKWSFRQLRRYIQYKAALTAVPVVVVDPRYTSQTCSLCHHVGNRKGGWFQCNNSGNNMDADVNAGRNIATLGATVNSPERCGMYSCAVHY